MSDSYVHHVPGRLRVRAAAVKGSEEKAAAVRALLEPVSGVRSVAANPLTGSVTIHYDQQVTNHLRLMDLLDERGYFLGCPVAAPVAAPVMNVSVSRSPKSQLGSMVATTVATFVVEKVVEHAILALLATLL